MTRRRSRFHMLHYNRSRFVRFVAHRRDIGTPTPGKIDDATFIDGEPGLVKQHFGTDVPRGAPFFVRGWAVDLGRRDLPWDLRVEIDGRPFPARVARGDARPDIVKLVGAPAVHDCGFRAYIDTRSLCVGPHELRIRAIVGRRGTAYAKLPDCTRFFVHDCYPTAFAPPDEPMWTTPWFGLDPVREIAVGHVLDLTGWALDARGAPLRAIAARIDREPWQAGWAGVERAERRGKCAPRGFGQSGFGIRIRLDTFVAGTHRLQLAGRTAAGTWTGLGESVPLVLTHPAAARSPWLRNLASPGEAVITTVDGIGDACWANHRVDVRRSTAITGMLRRSSPPGVPVTLVVRAADGSERCFAAWSAPTSNPNALMFGAQIAAGMLRAGSHELFVDAPDASGRSAGRAATGCRLVVEAAAPAAACR